MFQPRFIPKADEDRTVRLEKYLDMALTDALSAPRESLQTNNFDKGLLVLQFSAYQAEVLARAKGLVKIENDTLDIKDYKMAIEAEKINLGDVDKVVLNTKLAMFQIAYLLKQIEDERPRTKERRV